MPKVTEWINNRFVEREARSDELTAINNMKLPPPVSIDIQAKLAINLLPAETRAYHYEHITKIRSALKEKDYDVIPLLLDQITPRNPEETSALIQLKGILNNGDT